MVYNFRPAVQTFNLYIPKVLEIPCDKHDVPIGIPCFRVKSKTFGYSAGICNKRARARGYNHRISPEALSRNKKTKKPNR